MQVLKGLEEDDYAFMMERTEQQRETVHQAIKDLHD